MKMHLEVPPLFNFNECLWFLHRNYDECLYSVESNRVVRAVRYQGDGVLFSVSNEDSLLKISVMGEVRLTNEKQAWIRSYISRWFDLDRDIDPFREMLTQSGQLVHLWNSYRGLRLMGIPDMFEAICWCILGQQINLSFAYRLKRRLVEAYGSSVVHQDNSYWMFPTPAELLDASSEDLRGMQLSKQKIDYLLETAKEFESGNLSFQQCAELIDQEQRLNYLQSFKGIGPWTANYVLMKCLQDTTAIPWGDAGLLLALERNGLISNRKDRVTIEKLFSDYQGFQSYLVLYLWRSLATKK